LDSFKPPLPNKLFQNFCCILQYAACTSIATSSNQFVIQNLIFLGVDVAWFLIERFHAGNYSCRAANAAGTDLYTAQLSVNGKKTLISFSYQIINAAGTELYTAQLLVNGRRTLQLLDSECSKNISLRCMSFF